MSIKILTFCKALTLALYYFPQVFSSVESEHCVELLQVKAGKTQSQDSELVSMMLALTLRASATS